jgi:uncharacterized repeat protein (TIGR02543 family)
VAVVAVGVLLAAAGVLAVGAFGRSADSSLIVPDTSIGDVALGMTRGQVEAAYGTPDSTLQIALRGGGVGVLARYLTHGGMLLVGYADDRVVSVETTSPFFKTRNGVGPGRSKSGLHGYREEYCSGGLWDGTADMPPDQHITVFALSGEQVFSVTITEYGYYDVCAHAPPEQEGADPREGNVSLSVTVSPDGAGFVRSAPYAIDCPSSCSTTFLRGTVVTLTATPTAGFTFDGWGGACSGTGGCTVTADEARSVTAHFSGAFEPPPPTTTVIKTTTGGTN